MSNDDIKEITKQALDILAPAIEKKNIFTDLEYLGDNVFVRYDNNPPHFVLTQAEAPRIAMVVMLPSVAIKYMEYIQKVATYYEE